MTNKKILLGLACLAAVNLGGSNAYAASDPFAAVPVESGLYEDVAALVHDGLIYGFTDSTFDATHPLSRYEMAIFTGKAMSAYQKASPADKARINKLASQFHDELVGMGAKFPSGAMGGASSSNKKKNTKKNGSGSSGGSSSRGGFGNVQISGHVEHLFNAEHKTYVNVRNKSNRYSNSTTDHKNNDIEMFLNMTANLGGGWKGNMSFFAARDRVGDWRTNENTTGQFDLSRVWVQGPINKRQNLELGRMKSSTFKSIVMGEYWTGARLRQKINNKLTLAYSAGKPDMSTSVRRYKYAKYDESMYVVDPTDTSMYSNYAKVTGVTVYDKKTGTTTDGHTVYINPAYIGTQTEYPETNATGGALQMSYSNADAKTTISNNANTFINLGSDAHYHLYVPIAREDYKGDRSVADTYINPANVGISFESIEADYRWSNKLRLNAGYWNTHAPKAGYDGTHLWEGMISYDPCRKWSFTANFAKSDRSEQNVAQIFKVQYGRYSASQAHSWATWVYFGRGGRQSYIKNGYDIKDDTYGGKGLEYYFVYVPRKNVTATFRYLCHRPLQPDTANHDFFQSEYRGELDWFF